MKTLTHLIYITIISLVIILCYLKISYNDNKAYYKTHKDLEYTRYIIDYSGIVIDAKRNPNEITWIEINRNIENNFAFEYNGVELRFNDVIALAKASKSFMANQVYAIHEIDSEIKSFGFVPNPDLIIIYNGIRAKLSDGILSIAELYNVPGEKRFKQEIIEKGELFKDLIPNAAFPK